MTRAQRGICGANMIDYVLDVRYPSILTKLFEVDSVENGCVVYCVDAALRHVGVEIQREFLVNELCTNKKTPGTRPLDVERWLSCQRIAFESPTSPTPYLIRKMLEGLQVPAIWLIGDGEILHAVMIYGVRENRMLTFDPSLNLKKERMWKDKGALKWVVFIKGNTFGSGSLWDNTPNDWPVPSIRVLADLSRGLRTLGLRLKRDDPVLNVLKDISVGLDDPVAAVFCAMVDDIRNGEDATECLPAFLDIIPLSVARVLREGESVGDVVGACAKAADILDQMCTGSAGQ